MPPSGSSRWASKPAETTHAAGLNARRQLLEPRRERLAVDGVVGAGGEREVAREPPSPPRPDFVPRAAPREERVAVKREEEGVVALPEVRLGPVPVVDVEVDDCDGTAAARQQLLRRDRDVVEEAEPHRPVAQRVVAGRPHRHPDRRGRARGRGAGGGDRRRRPPRARPSTFRG